VTPALAAPELAVDRDRVDGVAALVAADPAAFGGVSMDEASGTLTVRYALATGVTAARARLSAAPNVAKAVGQSAAGGLRIELVPVQRSLQELEAVRSRVGSDPDWRRVAGGVMSQWYVDVRRNTVAVGVTELTPALQAAARGIFGEAVSLHSAGWLRRTSRSQDTPPLEGGIWLAGSGSFCTSGFVVKRVYPYYTLRAMVTAGHCFPDGIAVTNWSTHVGQFYNFFTDGGLDFGYVCCVTTDHYRAWTYLNSPTSDPEIVAPVGGARTPVVGASLCTNGAASLLSCGATVEVTDMCASDGPFGSTTTCHLARMRFANGNPTGEGDSGGNVVSWQGFPLRLKVSGIIVGREGASVYFHPYTWLIGNGWQVDIAS
jgi:hypothetical protein